jgi:hypothetical protein
MKKLYFLDEEEKNRILSIHESATKRQYLSEQWGVGQSYTSPSELEAIKNKKKVTPKVAPKVAPKVDPKVAQNKQLVARRQQVVANTNNTTKQIQKLLGLPETGVMDSSLLQKINEKLNGNQQTPTPGSNTQPRPQVEPIQQLTPVGVTTPKLTTMSPEDLSARLGQQLTGLKK